MPNSATPTGSGNVPAKKKLDPPMTKKKCCQGGDWGRRERGEPRCGDKEPYITAKCRSLYQADEGVLKQINGQIGFTTLTTSLQTGCNEPACSNIRTHPCSVFTNSSVVYGVDGWEKPLDLQAHRKDKVQFRLAEEVHLLHQCPGVFLF